MLAGAAERDLSIELFGLELPTPLMLAPVGVIGLCAQDGHGDLATARAAARDRGADGRLDAEQDPMEDVAAAARRHARAGSSSTRPNDRELTESLVHRAEAAGFRASWSRSTR